MDRGESLTLDVVRVTAAAAVFLSHYATQAFSGGLLWQFQPYGAEAVDVFFVLSGYLIGYAADVREASGATYAVNRAARIYSVALPALAATFLLDAVGRAVDPGVYAALPKYQPDHPAWQAFSGLCFVNQVWSWETPVGSDVPYWSLGYEVWYYVIFGIGCFAPARWRMPGALAAMLLAGPRIAVLFPLWLAGFACWRLRRRGVPRTARMQRMLVLAPVALWTVYEAGATRYGRPFGLTPDWLDRKELPQDYLIGLLFSAQLLGLGAAGSWAARLPSRAARAIRWLAGATFAAYLFHFPVMAFLRAMMPADATSWNSRLALLTMTPLVILALAEVTERRKAVWRRAFASLLTAGTRLAVR